MRTLLTTSLILAAVWMSGCQGEKPTSGTPSTTGGAEAPDTSTDFGAPGSLEETPPATTESRPDDGTGGPVLPPPSGT